MVRTVQPKVGGKSLKITSNSKGKSQARIEEMNDINVQGAGKDLEPRSALKVPQIPATLNSKSPNRQGKK